MCFRRCGRVRKKHHCEADEDPTRQWLQRRVSAVQYTYQTGSLATRTRQSCVFSLKNDDYFALLLGEQRCRCRDIVEPWTHSLSVKALQRLLGPVSHAKQLISSPPPLPSRLLFFFNLPPFFKYTCTLLIHVRGPPPLGLPNNSPCFLFHVRGWKVVIDTGLLMICFAARPRMALILPVVYFKRGPSAWQSAVTP